MPEPTLARHDLAWLLPAACSTASLIGRACIDETAARAKLAAWVAAGRPLFVTRQPADAGSRIALGLALPPQLGKFRLGFLVDRAAIIRLGAAPGLADVIQHLPLEWQAKAAALLAAPAINATRPRVYGSAAMQVVCGEPCLSPGSDLDLAFSPANWPAACALVAALAKIESANPAPRVDGEVVTPSGDAVAWRELLDEPARVLVKSLGSVELEAIADFSAAFSAAERRAA